MTDDIHNDLGPPDPRGEAHFNPAGELVRFAEKLIEQGDLAQALECLHEARKRQPENLYIGAVMQRAESLQRARSRPLQAPPPKPLSITVDTREPSGVRREPADPSGDVNARIRRLTIVASRLFDRGAFDAAFESLMKAYLLDPANPLVIACEKQMMPVWNTLRKTGFQEYSRERFLAERKSAQPPPPQAAPPAPPSPPPQDPAARLEERKRQLEQQRKEREQTMWRNASQLPKNMGPKKPEGPESRPPATPRLRDLDKHDRPNLLRWLKGG